MPPRNRQPRSTWSRFLPALLAVAAFLQWTSPPLDAATIPVTTTSEPSSDTLCSLREAIRTANSDLPEEGCVQGSGPDMITVPAGTYVLSVPGPGEDVAATGDLDLTSEVTIEGVNADAVTIDASGIDRVFDVLASGNVTLRGLTITNGTAVSDDGGAIRNEGNLLIEGCRITDSSTTGDTTSDGGGILNQGDSFNPGTTGNLTIVDSEISGNISADRGGGIYNISDGDLILVNVTISGNQAADDGGGIATSGTTSSLALDNVTVAGNHSDDATAGGGIDIQGGDSLILHNTIVADNTSLDLDCTGQTVTMNHSLVEAAHNCTVTGANNLAGDPRLLPLASAGGPTRTHPLCLAAMDPDPSCGGPSIALDAGETSMGGTASGACIDRSGSPSLSFDQRGAERAQGGGLGGVGCDMGAFEAASTTPPVPVELSTFAID